MRYNKFLPLILLNSFTVSLHAQLTQPYLQIPKLKVAPKIDGKLSVEEWDNTALVTDYVMWTLDAYAPDRVETHLGFDKENIYVSFKGFISDKKLFSGTLEEYKPIDSHLWGRNHFGVLLIKDTVVIEIKAGPSLSKMDFKNGELAWNGKWDFKASINEANWMGEFKIPFTDLGIKAPPTGETWRIILTWCNPSGTDALWSGKMKFTDKNPVACQFEKWPHPVPGDNNLTINFKNNGAKKETINCEILLLPFSGYPAFLNQQGQDNNNAEMQISLKEKPIVVKKTISIPANSSLSENINYKIVSEGNYYAVVSCINSFGDTLRQSTGYWFTVAPDKEKLIQLS